MDRVRELEMGAWADYLLLIVSRQLLLFNIGATRMEKMKGQETRLCCWSLFSEGSASRRNEKWSAHASCFWPLAKCLHYNCLPKKKKIGVNKVKIRWKEQRIKAKNAIPRWHNDRSTLLTPTPCSSPRSLLPSLSFSLSLCVPTAVPLTLCVSYSAFRILWSFSL